MKKVISVMMVVVLLASVVLTMGAALTSNGFTYEVENGEVVITGYNNTGSAIDIPATIDGKPVTKIGNFAFADRVETKGSDITSLTLPSSLKVIGDGAFSVNSTITSLSIPANVESIGARAFHTWIKLSNITFEGKKLKSIGAYAFRNCHSLSSLSLPSGIERLDTSAFSYCPALSSVTLPESLEEIGFEEFIGCTALSEVTILNSDLAIGDNAFDLTVTDSSDSAKRGLLIKGYPNSSAKRFASAEGFKFEEMDVPEEPEDPGTPTIGSGEYCIRVTYTITGSNNIQKSYGGFNTEVNDSAGISLLYKAKNGTAEDYKEQKWDIKNAMTNGGTGTYTLTASLDGFPYLLYGYLDDNAAFGSAAYNINKLEVGSSFTDMKQVWSGKICVTSKINAFGVSVDWDNNQKANYFNTDGNNKVESSSGKWEKPYAKTMSNAYENTQLSLNKTAGSVANTFTYAAADQYGVKFASSLCTVTTASSVSAANSSITTTASGGSGTTTCQKAAHVATKGQNAQTVTATFKWAGKDKTVNSTAQFTLEDEKYTIKYYNDKNEYITEQEVYYGDLPQMAAPEKDADADYHYSAGSWSPALTAATADASYTAAYTAEEHQFLIYEEESVPADCENAGKTVYFCYDCLFTKEETVPATGHNYEETTVAPDCTHAGYTLFTCSNCGDSYQGAEVPALGHSYTATTVAPDCTHAGYTVYTCSTCQTSYRGDEVAALGHNYQKEVVAPDCTHAGYTVFTCSTCADTYQGAEVPATGHSYTATVVEPDCTQPGYTVYTCSACLNSYRGDDVAALGHNYEVTTVAADCTHAGYTLHACSRCGNSFKDNESPATGHSYQTSVVEPDCTHAGYTLHTCSACGNSYQDNEVAAAGHNYQASTVAPDCTHQGYTLYTCSACGDNYQVGIQPALGHSYEDTTVAPDCTHGGYTLHTCTVCKESYRDAEKPAAGHQYQDTVVAPDCTNGGYTVHTCSVCKDTYTDSELPALGHSYGETVVPSTCLAGGYTVYSCTLCQKTYYGKYTSALGHDFSLKAENSKTLRTAATVSVNPTYYYSCSHCKLVGTTYYEKLTASFSGAVDVSRCYKPLVVTLLKDGIEMATEELQPKGDGNFCFFGLEPDVYTVVIRGEASTVAEFSSVDLCEGEKLDLEESADNSVSLIEVSLGDVNSDGDIDMSDISVLLSEGIYTNENALGTVEDINNDGVINVTDLSLVLFEDNYGKSSKVLSFLK